MMSESKKVMRSNLFGKYFTVTKQVVSVTALMFVGMQFLTSASSVQADIVQARVGKHATYSRIVFDWRQAVSYQVQKQGRQLTVHFARPIETDISAIVARTAGYVQQIVQSPDQKTLTFYLSQAYPHRIFKTKKNAVVVDIIGQAGAVSPTAAQGLQQTMPSGLSKAAALSRLTGQSVSQLAAAGLVQTAPTGGAQVTATPAVPDRATASRPQAQPRLQQASANTQEFIRVRGGNHKGFSRLVFDRAGRIPVKINRDGERAFIVLSDNIRLDLSKVTARVRNVQKASSYQQNGQTVAELLIPASSGIRHFATGNKLVIDVTNPSRAETVVAQANQPVKRVQSGSAIGATSFGTGMQVAIAPPAVAPDTAAPTQEPKMPTGTVASQGEAPKPLIQPAPVAPAPVAPVQVAPAQNTPAQNTTPPSIGLTDSDRSESPTTSGQAISVPLTSSTSVAQPVQPQSIEQPASQPIAAQPVQTEQAQPILTQAAPAPTLLETNDLPRGAGSLPDSWQGLDVGLLPPGARSVRPAPNQPITVQVGTGQDGATLGFAWPYQVPIAVFKDNNALWVAFDETRAFDFSEIKVRGGDFIRNGDLVEDVIGGGFSGGGVALRFDISPGLEPIVTRDGSMWMVHLARQTPELRRVLYAEEQFQNVPPRHFIPSRSNGATLIARDPVSFKKFYITPILDTGAGFSDTLEYPGFRLVRTAQGVVTNPNDETVYARSTDEGIAIQSPTGLASSSMPTSSGQMDADAGEGPKMPQLFPLVQWRLGDEDHFLDGLEKIDTAVASSLGRSTEIEARLQQAQYYFAHGLFQETRAMVERIVEEAPHYLEDRVFQAMRGVTHLMLNDLVAAEKDLMIPSLDGEPEAELWRAILAVRQGDANRAINTLNETEPLVERYARSVRAMLRMRSVAAGLMDQDVNTASQHLDLLANEPLLQSEREQFQLLQGKFYRLNGEMDSAMRIFEQTTDAQSQFARTHAIYDWTMLQLENKEIGLDEAIERFELLRWAWRGDAFEFNVLANLGQFYLDKKDYRNGLIKLRMATNYFSNTPYARVSQKKMEDVFLDLYLHDKADELPPLTALALFDEFRDLTPVTPEGDVMIQKLADRLIDVDLLDRAGLILDHQVRLRLTGVQKSKIGKRLAEVRLLDRNPKLALAALDISEIDEPIDPELARQRLHLRVLAMAGDGTGEEGLDLIEEDDTREAEQLRAAVYWDIRDWAGAAMAYQRLAEPATMGDEPITAEEMKYVMRWAIALYLDEDPEGMTLVRDMFEDTMMQTKYADAFKLIVSGTANPTQLRTVTEELGEIEIFQSFMASLRQDLAQANVETNAATN